MNEEGFETEVCMEDDQDKSFAEWMEEEFHSDQADKECQLQMVQIEQETSGVAENVEPLSMVSPSSNEDEVIEIESSEEEVQILYAGISTEKFPDRSDTEIPANEETQPTESPTTERQGSPAIPEAPASKAPSTFTAPTSPEQSSAMPSASIHPAIILPTGPRIYFPGGEPTSGYDPATVDLRVNLPIYLYRQGPGMNRLQRQELMNAGLQLEKIKMPFLEDSEIGIFRKKKQHSSRD